jgi:pyruvate/2-oxoglutarate dehydrogenase complex dihydrolipoamide acyltransferase (E2) component
VFKVVPLALIKPVFEQAKRVAIGDAKTLVQRRAYCVDMLAKMGIELSRVLAKIEKKSLEDVTVEDLEILFGLFNAVKDGEVTHEDAFPAVTAGSKKPEFPPTGTVQPSVKHVVPPIQKPAEPAKPAEPEVVNQMVATAQTAAPAAPAPQPAPAEPVAAPTPPQTAATAPAAPGGSAALQGVLTLMATADVNEKQVMAFCQSKKMTKPDQTVLSQLPDVKLSNICKAWGNIVQGIKAQPSL